MNDPITHSLTPIWHVFSSYLGPVLSCLQQALFVTVRHLGVWYVPSGRASKTRWRSVTNSSRSRRSCGKIGDCEKPIFLAFIDLHLTSSRVLKNANKKKTNTQPKWPQAWWITDINPGYQPRSQGLPWKLGLTFTFTHKIKITYLGPHFKHFFLPHVH